ncbi:MAG: PQQ-binding-like beta-propeller repeat protein [Candidatus Moraniibacteriota bacterium]
MSKILHQIIAEKVYKEKEIRSISEAGGKPVSWIFDFKSQSLRKDFIREYAAYFWRSFDNQFPGTIQIGGMETGAIPLVTGVSVLAPENRRVNVFYIRKSRKKSDLANLLEGELTDDPIVLVDDILNQGRTMRKQIAIIKELGKQVSAIFVCIRYRDLSHYQDLIDHGIAIVSIFELNDFQDVFPVRNIVDTVPDPKELNRYQIEYRVKLTDKPNLYLVVPKSAPLLADEYLYMGADDGNFFCIRVADGQKIWSYRVVFGAKGKYIHSSPAVYRDRLIFGAYDGNLYCLNRFTGKLQWVFSDADWIGSSPCVNETDGVVYVGLEFGLPGKHGGVVAIDIETGGAKWKNYTFPGLTHASPVYNAKSDLVVCGSNDTECYALRSGTGEIVWQFKTLGEVKYGAVFDDARDLVIFGGMDGSVYVLRTRDGMLCRRFEARFGFYSTPALRDGKIIIGSLDKKVYCFDLETGGTAWEFETAGRIFSSPALDGGSVFIGSNDGRLYELEVSSGKALAVVQLSERIVNRIQISHQPDGKRSLFIPTHACELYKVKEI